MPGPAEPGCGAGGEPGARQAASFLPAAGTRRRKVPVPRLSGVRSRFATLWEGQKESPPLSGRAGRRSQVERELHVGRFWGEAVFGGVGFGGVGTRCGERRCLGGVILPHPEKGLQVPSG